MASFISRDQAQAADILVTIALKVVALGVVLVLLVVGFGFFVYVVLYKDSAVATTVSGVIESALGVVAREMYKGLFGSAGSSDK